jgi:hypothetical protein
VIYVVSVTNGHTAPVALTTLSLVLTLDVRKGMCSLSLILARTTALVADVSQG